MGRKFQGGSRRVAKRDPYSRWRRLPPVFRSGEHKLPGAGDEPQRIILYLKGALLDQAEEQAEKAGVPTLQEYCAGLLARAIEVERVKHQVADVEAKRGPLRGVQRDQRRRRLPGRMAQSLGIGRAPGRAVPAGKPPPDSTRPRS